MGQQLSGPLDDEDDLTMDEGSVSVGAPSEPEKVYEGTTDLGEDNIVEIDNRDTATLDNQDNHGNRV